MDSLKLTAAGWLFTSIGHLISAKDWQSNAKFSSLPNQSATAAKIGWAQGSGFFLLNALINYAWSQDRSPLQQPVHQAMAVVMALTGWGSALWYGRRGVMPSAMFVTGIMGTLQAYSAFVSY